MVIGPLFPLRQDVSSSRPRKWHQMIYTQDLHSRKKFKNKNYLISQPSVCPIRTIATFTLSHSIKDPVMMHSSGENCRKRNNDSDKRGAYQKFDEASSRMRESLLHNSAERFIAHAASNGGSCRRGFVKDMVLGILTKVKTRVMINNIYSINLHSLPKIPLLRLIVASALPLEQAPSPCLPQFACLVVVVVLVAGIDRRNGPRHHRGDGGRRYDDVARRVRRHR